jgi:hypothetical protein
MLLASSLYKAIPDAGFTGAVQKVRDRFGPEEAGISIVLSGGAKLYSFPQVWMFFGRALLLRCDPRKFWAATVVGRAAVRELERSSRIFLWISLVQFA